MACRKALIAKQKWGEMKALFGEEVGLEILTEGIRAIGRSDAKWWEVFVSPFRVTIGKEDREKEAEVWGDFLNSYSLHKYIVFQ